MNKIKLLFLGIVVSVSLVSLLNTNSQASNISLTKVESAMANPGEGGGDEDDEKDATCTRKSTGEKCVCCKSGETDCTPDC